MNRRDFVPPIISKTLTRLRTRPTPTFASYEAARTACGAGYDDSALAEIVLAKTKEVREKDVADVLGASQTSATLLALMTTATQVGTEQPISVLDFGGAMGVSYLMAAQRTELQLRWAVVETAAFVRIACELESESLRFFSSVSDAVAWLGGVDLVYSSGALQYTPSPEESLSTLLRLGASCVALLRSAFSLGERVVEIQSSLVRDNGPGPLPKALQHLNGDNTVSYPRVFARRSDMMAACARSYRLLAHLATDTERRSLGGQSVVLGEAYLWEKRTRVISH